MNNPANALYYPVSQVDLDGGSHVCLLFSVETERRVSISQYVHSALSKGDKFLYVADQDPDSVTNWLNVSLSHLEKHSEQFSIDIAESVYCSCGTFVPSEMIEQLRGFYQTSINSGYAGFSGTGEMWWAIRNIPGSEHLIDYESRLNGLVSECPLTLLCQYDLNLFDGGIILDVLRVHPMVLINGQVVQNPFYRSPDSDHKIHASEGKTSILAELLLVQSLLDVFPTERKIGEFVCNALINIPGCSACAIDLSGNDRFNASNTDLIQRSRNHNTSSNSVENWESRVTFLLKASTHFYGYLHFNIQDSNLFDEYKPHILTIANSIAVTFESHWQQRELSDEINQHKSTERELQEANIKLRNLSNTDALTGLYNRRYCFQKIPEEVVRSLRLGLPIVLVMIDMNNFKAVNDELGHDEGNRLLKVFAAITHDVLRDSIDFVFRIGGDEFVILMGDCTQEKAQYICGRLDKKFSETNDIVSLAYGIVQLPENLAKQDITGNQSWLEKLLREADQRMYLNKSKCKS